jgi:hypothetical protein
MNGRKTGKPFRRQKQRAFRESGQNPFSSNALRSSPKGFANSRISQSMSQGHCLHVRPTALIRGWSYIAIIAFNVKKRMQ